MLAGNTPLITNLCASRYVRSFEHSARKFDRARWPFIFDLHPRSPPFVGLANSIYVEGLWLLLRARVNHPPWDCYKLHRKCISSLYASYCPSCSSNPFVERPFDWLSRLNSNRVLCSIGVAIGGDSYYSLYACTFQEIKNATRFSRIRNISTAFVYNIIYTIRWHTYNVVGRNLSGEKLRCFKKRV